jgi:hypothetical protein
VPGDIQNIPLTHDVYDGDALRQAITDYAERLAVAMIAEDALQTTVSVSSPDGTAPDEPLAREFLNYVLDLSVRAKLGGM